MNNIQQEEGLTSACAINYVDVAQRISLKVFMRDIWEKEETG